MLSISTVLPSVAYGDCRIDLIVFLINSLAQCVVAGFWHWIPQYSFLDHHRWAVNSVSFCFCFYLFLSIFLSMLFSLRDLKHFARWWQKSHWSSEHFIWRALRRPDCVLSQHIRSLAAVKSVFFLFLFPSNIIVKGLFIWFLNIAKLWQAAVCQFLWIFIAFVLMHACDQAELLVLIFHAFLSICFLFPWMPC